MYKLWISKLENISVGVIGMISVFQTEGCLGEWTLQNACWKRDRSLCVERVNRQLPCPFITLYDAWTSPHFLLEQILNYDILMFKTKTLGMPQGPLKDMKNIEC